MSDPIDILLQRARQLQEELSSGAIVADTIPRYESDILELQRLQLLEGKASDGEDLRPYYSEDLKPQGYFRNADSAERYARWKATEIQYPVDTNRNPDAPNLYINGQFHSELGVEFGANEMTVQGTTMKAQAIILKYGLDKFGLTVDKLNEIVWGRGLYKDILENVERLMYGTR